MADAVRKAIKAHNNQTKDCLGGGGFDRHIFGLKTQGTILSSSLVLKCFSCQAQYRLASGF